MRLLHAKTYILREFPEKSIPTYAILSHTWEDDEVTFQDIQGKSRHKKGYVKIRYACQQAVSEKLNYIWVDTCCIDKSSSAELSEAINSMFQWYKNAEVCYVYLADVSAVKPVESERSLFRKSRWFTRGWTLQELIAPAKVGFYSKDWKFLGWKHQLTNLISEITGIDDISLCGGDLHRASIAQRMSWASRRVTTRTEDIAYSLLGIFGVNMAMIYGEGEKAFLRLQEEIIKESDDQSLFAWGLYGDKFDERRGILAPSPSYFSNSKNIVPCKIWKTTTPHSMTSKGLRIEIPILQTRPLAALGTNQFYGILSCHENHDLFHLLEVPLRKVPSSTGEYIRSGPIKPGPTQERDSKTFQPQSIYIHRSPPFVEDSRRDKFLFTCLDIFDQPKTGLHCPSLVSYQLHEVFPPILWDDRLKILSPRSIDAEFVHTVALLHFHSEIEPDFVIIVEYMPAGSPVYGVSQGRCFAKLRPEDLSSQQIIEEETEFLLDYRDGYVPFNNKMTDFVHKFSVTLKKEEVMGIEMFVVDFELSFPIHGENLEDRCYRAADLKMGKE